MSRSSSPPPLEVLDAGDAREFYRRNWKQRWMQAAVETGFIVLLFFIAAGSPPPGVGEAHYLAKAKHYWDPAWCAGDLFLESADAHWTFYWCFGWVTKYCSLETTAWIGRAITWLLLGWSWQRLSFALVPQRLYAILSAGLMLLFTRWFHLAGEWVIGGIEAKSFAYVFFFLAVESLVRRRWSVAWLWMGAAAAFHVLIGGWGCVLLGGVWLLERRLPDTPRLLPMLPAVVGGFLLSLPGLIPALLLNRGVDSALLQQATTAYVYERLPHHLVFHRFEHLYMARHVVLLLAWAAIAWRQRQDVRARALHWLVLGAVLVGVIGVIIDQSLLNHRDLAARLLRYYWFRLSDALLGCGVALGLAYQLAHWQATKLSLYNLAVTVSVLAIGADMTHEVWSRSQLRVPGAFLQPKPTQPPANPQHKTISIGERELFEQWREVCNWIEQETPRSARFLTPRRQQTFKWYAQRPEVVNWKDVPQDAAGLVRWKQAMDEIYSRATFEFDLAAHSNEQLLALAHKYQANYIVLDRTRAVRNLPWLRVYPPLRGERSAYEVYVVPPTKGEQP
jgi:hypothetical protein